MMATRGADLRFLLNRWAASLLPLENAGKKLHGGRIIGQHLSFGTTTVRLSKSILPRICRSPRLGSSSHTRTFSFCLDKRGVMLCRMEAPGRATHKHVSIIANSTEVSMKVKLQVMLLPPSGCWKVQLHTRSLSSVTTQHSVGSTLNDNQLMSF